MASKKKRTKRGAPASSRRRTGAAVRRTHKSKARKAAPRKRRTVKATRAKKSKQKVTKAKQSKPRKVARLEEETYDTLLRRASQSFVETRAFLSSAALLGYFEGRPGVQEIVAVYPMRTGEPRRVKWTRAQRADALERLRETEIAGDVATEYDAKTVKEWERRVMVAAEYADDGGIVAEVMVSGDSGGSDRASPDE